MRNGNVEELARWSSVSIHRPVWAEISQNALRQNLQTIRKFLNGKTEILAIVKAEAYGHGAVKVAETLEAEGIRSFGVASLDEAIELRENGVKGDILILGYTSAHAAKELSHYRLQQTLFSTEMLKEFQEGLKALRKEGKTLQVQAKLDTGMGRLGVKTDDAHPFLQELFESFGADVKGIFTHFPKADCDEEFTRLQMRTFQALVAPFLVNNRSSITLHMANSAAALRWKESWADQVRLGILLYGVNPIPNPELSLPLTPVMSVKARVIQVKELKKGEGCGYGHRFQASAPTKIAIVPIGYADGYSRAFSGKGWMRIRGKKAPILGNVSMDFTAVDVTTIPGVKAGEEVTILGEGVDAWELASWANSIPYEILCALGKRIPRLFVSPCPN